MRKLIYLLTILLTQFVFSQLESAHWYFGINAGLDFSSGSPVVVYDGALSTTEGCASISDPDGNLLFYTDGTFVYNKNHNIMPNGFNLLGNPSSTQSAIIVPYPGQLNLYYIFMVGADDNAMPGDTQNTGFNYAIVDMTLDGGLGNVLPFDGSNNLMPLTSEKVTAVAHGNNQSFWIITHFEDKFYSFLVDESGLNTSPVISQIGPYLDPDVYPVNSRGYIKLSPDGKKIAIAHLSNLLWEDIPQEIIDFGGLYTNNLFSNTYNGYTAVYDFDDETGVVSNEITLSTIGSPYGLEFSYESNYLYIEYDYHVPYEDDNAFDWIKGELIQYDMNAADIPGSAVVIFDDFPYFEQTFQARGALQLALDEKIYFSPTEFSNIGYSGNYISIIHSPDSPGAACNFEFRAIPLNNDENPSHYATYGLPPFITSFFRASIEFEGQILNSGACLGNSVTFSINSNNEILSVNWDFGDGNISTEMNPTHTYGLPGTYTVLADITTEEETITITRDIVIHPLPEALDAEIVKCDFDGDGLAIFELFDANGQVTTQTGNIITYHETEEDALSGENPLDNVYENISNPQTIYVRIKSPLECIDTSELILSTNLQEIKTVSDLALCDLNSDGLETFNLNERITEIEALYDEPITVLSFHETIYDAERGLNVLNTNYPNTSNPQPIYVRVQTSGCIEVVSFQLILNALPFIDLEDVEICPDGNWTLDAGNGFTSYLWDGLQDEDLNQPTDQPQITISVPGTYSIIVENEEGCEYEDFFNVTVKELPEIIEIIVSGSDIATVTATGDDPFEYSLNGVLWQSSNEFTNLNPGDYTIWVRDATGCISVQKGFGILEIPNFISPNKDGYNDIWSVRGISNYEDVRIRIFDRYGKIIVDRLNNHSPDIWDGIYLGRVVNTGSYWYIIEVKDGRKYVGTLAVRNY